MNILVINCGSSSLKYQLINSESEEVLAKGLCERIGIDGSCITHQPKGGEKVKTEIAMPTHTPVSYTHLDVYKRQAISTGFICPRIFSGRIRSCEISC